MASPPEGPGGGGGFSDVRKVGYLRKPKSMHKRFFVLRAASEAGGPARLEYYENEKKWRHKSGAPKRSIPLESCFNINKRADSKNKHLVALYTRDEHFAVAADSESEQESWYQALLQLHNRAKGHPAAPHEASGPGGPGGPGSGGGGGGGSPGPGEAGEDGGYGDAAPGPAFREVWQVILKPKGLGQTKNLIGIYRLCLTSKTISLVKLNSEAAAVVLQLMNIRRCGHSENFFFIEVGRSAVTGPGEFWMQVDDSVVAQNMHETILEAMRAMSEEFRPRSKSQSSSGCSNPISVPLRRHHLNNPPPSQVGLSRRSRTESVTATSPAGAAAAGARPCSFRVRASSDGEGTMSRPASVDGSPVSPGAGRSHGPRQRGGPARLHPPLHHSRSIPMPAARRSPSATSPVSLSSSSTSGHGSTSDCLFPRRSSASVSGSPSDGGFVSSDEYGSSPGDFRGSFRSVTPDSLGHTPPARPDEELSDYICMGGPGGRAPNGLCAPLPRGGPRAPGPAGPGDEAELDKGFRKRTHSAGTSPTAALHKAPAPPAAAAAAIQEYTEMAPPYPPRPACRHSAFVPTRPYPEEGPDLPRAEAAPHPRADAPALPTDDGYMPMSPGVAPLPGGGGGRKGGADYMPMSPKSVSAPQQILHPGRRHAQRVDPNGYMMMSPSGSCSPDGAGPAPGAPAGAYAKLWTNGLAGPHPAPPGHPKLPGEGGDYINMSPAGDSAAGSPSDCCCCGAEDAQAKAAYSFYSLPRSFKHSPQPPPPPPPPPPQRRGDPEDGPRLHPLRLAGAPGRLLCPVPADDSSSGDSLGGGGGGAHEGAHGRHHHHHHQPLQPHLPRKVDVVAQTKNRLARPTRLSLDGPKASTLPRAREQPQQPLLPPEPKSPGEYVNIEFVGDPPGYPRGPAASLCSPAVRCPAQRQPAPRGGEDTGSEEYMNMDLRPPRRPACQDGFVAKAGRACPLPAGVGGVCRPSRVVPSSQDYVTMQVGGPCPGCADASLGYVVMQTSGASEESGVPTATAAAAAPSPSFTAPSPSLPQHQGQAELAGRPSLLGGPKGPGGISAFTRVSLSPGRNQSAKVIRADPQGCRRRHSSETFSSTPTSARGSNVALPFGVAGAGGSGAPGSGEDVKRHSSASFENVWLKPGDLGGPPSRKEASQGSGGATAGLENGLNYIDLDLVKDFNHRPQECPPLLQPPHQPCGSSGGASGNGCSGEDLNAYASISFQKQPEDLP
ncbi:insulin receptor substrate 1 [Macrotis lagotis]|uniref:insulin receptor substrate 1 n=1 Tax=Macrotis lagotis TaxID=92651 RepID=UPI003D6889A2